MVGGKVVEQGATDDVLHRPLHAYTRLLLSAVRIRAPGFTQTPGPGRGDIDASATTAPRRLSSRSSPAIG